MFWLNRHFDLMIGVAQGGEVVFGPELRDLIEEHCEDDNEKDGNSLFNCVGHGSASWVKV